MDFSRGDLILLDEENTGETVLNSGWCAGTNERTELRGDFPAEAVYVLPCLNKPPDDILVKKILFWYKILWGKLNFIVCFPIQFI